MPKNKISGDYMANVIIYRGPLMIPHLPQFAPDRVKYDAQPHMDMVEFIKNNPDIKILDEVEPGMAEKLLDKKIDYV